MAKIKGVTLKKLREEFPYPKHFPSLWVCSYFVSTAGNVSSATFNDIIFECSSNRAFLCNETFSL